MSHGTWLQPSRASGAVDAVRMRGRVSGHDHSLTWRERACLHAHPCSLALLTAFDHHDMPSHLCRRSRQPPSGLLEPAGGGCRAGGRSRSALRRHPEEAPHSLQLLQRSGAAWREGEAPACRSEGDARPPAAIAVVCRWPLASRHCSTHVRRGVSPCRPSARLWGSCGRSCPRRSGRRTTIWRARTRSGTRRSCRATSAASLR